MRGRSRATAADLADRAGRADGAGAQQAVADVPGAGPAVRPTVQPYLMSWFRYDPAPVLADLAAAGAAGARRADAQVPAEQRAAARRQPAARLDRRGMDHLLALQRRHAPVARRRVAAQVADWLQELAPRRLSRLHLRRQPGRDAAGTNHSSSTITHIRKKNGMVTRAIQVISLAGHALQHEQVEAHRRRDLRHLHHDHDEDAEPDQVDAGAPAPSAGSRPWSAPPSRCRRGSSPG